MRTEIDLNCLVYMGCAYYPSVIQRRTEKGRILDHKAVLFHIKEKNEVEVCYYLQQCLFLLFLFSLFLFILLAHFPSYSKHEVERWYRRRHYQPAIFHQIITTTILFRKVSIKWKLFYLHCFLQIGIASICAHIYRSSQFCFLYNLLIICTCLVLFFLVYLCFYNLAFTDEVM